MDIRAYNQNAWDAEVEKKNPWTIPVTPETIAAARRGDWRLLLTPTVPVPPDWYPPIQRAEVLCLASAGGQQGPVLAAAGARVTVFDNSPRQLAQDRMVAQREGLEITTIQGDMRDLSCFQENIFDLIFHPVSNVFVPDILPVWREAFRVLKPGGVLLAGVTNPLVYIFDQELLDSQNKLEVRYSIPYSDLTSPSPELRQKYMAANEPLEFGHSLQDQIGGQLAAGFVLTGFFEDIAPEDLLCKYIPTFIATRAVKPRN